MPANFQLPVINNDTTFENFILHLYDLEYPDRNFQLFGKRGNRQKGADIISTLTGIAIQCKKKEVGKRNILNELKDEFEADIKKITGLKLKINQLIFTSTFDDNTQLIEYLQELKERYDLPFDVTYIGWQSISSRALKHKHLLKEFFPQLVFEKKKSILTPLPFFDPNLLLGRSDLLAEIHQHAMTDRLFVLEGIGGVGKTVSLSCYVSNHANEYDNIIWIESRLDSLKEDIITQMINIHEREPGFPKVTAEWGSIIHQLLGMEGKNLMVIDGIETPESKLHDIIEDVASTGWQVIVTSRMQLSDHPAIKVDGLPLESAKELFNRHFSREKDEKLVEKITILLEKHPLLVELVAKAANANKTLSLQELHSLLIEETIKSPHLQRQINVGRHSRKYATTRDQKIYNYLLRCFDISHLTPAEQQQLLYISTFTHSQSFSFESYLDITKQRRKKQAPVEDAVNRLEEKGWIRAQNSDLSIHPLIQLVVWDKLKISVKKVEPVMLTCTTRLAKVNSIDPWPLFEYISIAKNILQATKMTQESLKLSFLYGSALTKMGSYTGAIRSLEKCIEFDPDLITNDPTLAGGIFNNLGNAYRLTGKYDEAGKVLKKAMQIYESSGIDVPISFAHTWDNYATYLFTIGRLEESASITKKVIKIFQNKRSAADLAHAYTNLASTYTRLKKYTAAKRYWKKGFDLFTSRDEPAVRSSSFNILGMIYKGQKRYRFAKEAFKKGIDIHKKSPNPDILTILYVNLSLVELELHQFEEAEAHTQKAIELDRSIPGGNRQNLAEINEAIAESNIRKRNYKQAEKDLKAALSIYRELFSGSGIEIARTEQNLKTIRSEAFRYNIDATETYNLLYVHKEYIAILNKLFEKTVDRFGEIKAMRPESKEDSDVVHDYIFFCFTRCCKSTSSILRLIEKEKPEDAMTLLYTVYRTYLSIAYIIKYPEKFPLFVNIPIYVASGHKEFSKVINSMDVTEHTRITYSGQKKTTELYPLLSGLFHDSSYPEDKIAHDYLDPALNEHAYSSFMTAEGYRNDDNTHYQYNGFFGVSKAAFICLYLQVLILSEVCLYVKDKTWNVKVSRFLVESAGVIDPIIDALNDIDQGTKEAMKNRLNRAASI